MIKGTFHIKEESREDVLFVVGLGDAMQEANNIINCCSEPPSPHLFITEQASGFGQGRTL